LAVNIYVIGTSGMALSICIHAKRRPSRTPIGPQSCSHPRPPFAIGFSDTVQAHSERTSPAAASVKRSASPCSATASTRHEPSQSSSEPPKTARSNSARSRRPLFRPVPIPRVRPDPARRRPDRVDGPGRGLRRQRRDGVVFSLLQKNVLNRRRWETRDQLRLAILTWIEKTYHRRRRQDRLGRLKPIEFETMRHPAEAA